MLTDGNIFFADRRTVERQVFHAVHSIGRIVSRFWLRLTGERGAALQIILGHGSRPFSRTNAIQLPLRRYLVLHMATESRPGITGPWRLVSYFEIRSVICLLSKVTRLSLGNYVTASSVMGQWGAGRWPCAPSSVTKFLVNVIWADLQIS